jgi:diguanylate cyclase (GGDEF)-like protein
MNQNNEESLEKRSNEELENLLRSGVEPGVRSDICLVLARRFMNSNPPEALRYARESLEICEKNEDKPRIANSLINIGIIHAKKGEYPLSIRCFERALKIKQDIGDKQAIAMCYNNMALVYKNQNDYHMALELLNKSMAIKEELGDTMGIAFCLNNLQSIYDSLGDLDTALEYIMRSLALIKEVGTEKELASRYHNLGNIYFRKSEFDKSMEFFEKSSELNRKYNNMSSLASDFNGVAEIYRKKGDYETSLEYFNSSLSIYEELGNKYGMASELRNMGILFNEMCETTKAIDFSTRALALAREIGAIDCEKMVCENLSKTYEMLGDYLNALKYHKRFKELNDEIYSAEQGRKIARIEAKAEIEKKQKEAEVWKLASRTDPLTTLANRRGMIEKIEEEIHRLEGDGKQFSIVISDIDYFKKINDTYGHECGDRVLIEVAETIKQNLAENFTPARWGGEEFLILMPDTPIDEAFNITEKIRTSIERHEFEFDNQKLAVTMSFGLCQFSRGMSLNDCIRKADEALYEAKQSGRNRCITSS